MCRFVKKCTRCNVVRRGLLTSYASGWQTMKSKRTFSRTPIKMSVEDMIRFIEVRASGKRSAASMITPTSANELGDGEGIEAIGSAYRRQQRCPPPRQGQDHTYPTKGHTHRPRPSTGTRLPQPESDLNQESEPNTHSSAQDHAHHTRHMQFLRTTRSRRTGENAYRRVHCPAYGTTCTSCGRQNHTARVCWHSDIEHESAIFEQVDTMLEGTLNHQTWNRHTKCWTPRKSQPQPHLEVTMQPAGKTSGNTATHSDKRPKPSLWVPWQTLGARVAWQDHNSWPGYISPKQTSSL